MTITNYELWTFNDAVEHLIDVMIAGDQTARSYRLSRRAVLEAYRELGARKNWKYFYRRFPIKTVAPYDTGTLTYDHTGGASERLVTFSGATLPTDALHYELVIDDTRYEIERRLSSSTLTLTERANPGADVAAGTTYSLYRDVYPLPDDFAAMGEMGDIQTPGRDLIEVSLDQILAQNRAITSTGEPWQFAITRTKYGGGMGITFSPSPSTSRTYDFPYRARPRPLKTEKYYSGTASCTADSTSLTGAGDAAFTSDHEGAVIRLSVNASDLPTPVVGGLDDIENPFAMQAIIDQVTGAQAITLSQAAPATLSGVKFLISDPIDVEAGAMFTYFLRLCEAKYARIDNRDDANDREATAERAYLLAGEADSRSFTSSPRSYYPSRLADIARTVNYG